MNTVKRSTTLAKTKNTDDAVIGQNVRKLRMLAGLSQEKLGQALGLTFQQVQKYEKGTNRISGGRLVLIARILNCSLEDLFRDTGSELLTPAQVRTDPIRELGMNSRGLALAAAFTKLPPDLQACIVATCESAADYLPAKAA